MVDTRTLAARLSHAAVRWTQCQAMPSGCQSNHTVLSLSDCGWGIRGPMSKYLLGIPLTEVEVLGLCYQSLEGHRMQSDRLVDEPIEKKAA